MDVIVSPKIPTSAFVRDLQSDLQRILRQNSAVFGEPGPDQIELVAIIIPSSGPEKYALTFAMRSTDDVRLGVPVVIPPEAAPITIEEVLRPVHGYDLGRFGVLLGYVFSTMRQDTELQNLYELT